MSKTGRALSLKRTEVKNTRTERRYVCGGSAAHKNAVREFNRAQRQHGKTLCQEGFAGIEIQRELFFSPQETIVRAATGEGGFFDDHVEEANSWAIAAYEHFLHPSLENLRVKRKAHKRLAQAQAQRWGRMWADTYGLNRKLKTFLRCLAEMEKVCAPETFPRRNAAVLGPADKHHGAALNGIGRVVFEELAREEYGEEHDGDPTPRHHPVLLWLAEHHPVFFSHDYTRGKPVRIVDVPGGKYSLEEYDGREYLLTPETMQWVSID